MKGRKPEDFHRKSKFFDFYANQNATASSLALAIYQQMYLDPQMEIRGTMDLEILAKEKASVHSPYLQINNLGEELLRVGQMKQTGCIYRLYRLNRLMTSIQMDTPIPYVFKNF